MVCFWFMVFGLWLLVVYFRFDRNYQYVNYRDIENYDQKSMPKPAALTININQLFGVSLVYGFWFMVVGRLFSI